MVPTSSRQQPVYAIVVALAGLLLICCLCPLALNFLALVGTNGRTSIYSSVFPSSAHIGNISLLTGIITFQVLCGALLGLIVLIVGIVLFFSSRGSTTANNQPTQPPV